LDSPKIFISFAGQEKALALRLYEELSSLGADVFQFLESGRPGSVAWGQVLDSINEADWFLVLVSKSSVDSKAVKAEIEHAYHCRVNHDKPVLIPVILEDAQKPSELATFTELDFRDFDKGLQDLSKTIGLGIEDQGFVDRKHSATDSGRSKRTRGKLAAALICIIAVGAIGLWVFPLDPRFTVVTEPAGAVVTFASPGKPYVAGMRLAEGQYEVDVAAPGYESSREIVKHDSETGVHSISLSPQASAGPAHYVLEHLTCIDPQENDDDRVYLKINGTRSETRTFETGQTRELDLTVAEGAEIELWEVDGFVRDRDNSVARDDDHLGTVTVPNGGDMFVFGDAGTTGYEYHLTYRLKQ